MPRLLVCLFLVLAASAGEAAMSVRTYFVGNSVTDTVKYGLLQKLAESRGQRLPWGRHMIPGAPLFGMLHHGLDVRDAKQQKAHGFVEPPYGDCVQALTGHTWDALTLQPFDRRFESKEDKDPARQQGDVWVVNKFIELATAKSPEVQIYLYARWPRCYRNGKDVGYDKEAFDREVKAVSTAPRDDAAKANVDDLDVAWNSEYKNGWGQQLESKSYFEGLTRRLRELNPTMRKPVLLIPVGHVMAELNRLMKAGEVPGYRDIHGVYADGIHLDHVGSYLTACTFYACLFRQSPVGLPAEVYQVTDKVLAATIERTVWQVVSTHPLAGIAAAR